ncbi:phosphonate ABC transporter substrate-binding protein [Pseudolabrys sp. Root1462]|uniref:phosphonate ABC transporter substrate-binding protein n=1 Tax=Pseudolabrys sp. Root1462 TaxID=1736466 RepID=UPI000702FFD6|nr:phosphonate ABC transporter substrate-binding protein [Pseudolabrys sp. Root1462]KQY98132.1 phosphonate ABC transporter substrate-binding protein [Pseudolabrys sp. Root1462]
MRKLALLGTALAIVASISATAARAESEINFGVISTEASMNQKKNWEPFLADMTKATGLKINAFYSSDYAGVIEAMRFNKVQVAWYGNKSGMEAVDRSNAEVFAQTVSKDGSTGYYSHIIVNADSPYQKLEDVLKCDKSIDFGIGDPNSTSGFLVPTSYIFAAKNIDPKECFKTVRNASHQANQMAISHKQVQAATNNSEDMQRLQMSSPEDFKKIRVIWTSPIIPLDPLAWRKDLDPAVKTKLYTFLLGYGRVGTPDEIKHAKEVLANLIWSPFNPSSNNQLLPIRILEANKAMMKIKGDAKLSEAEKTAQIEPLQAEIKKDQAATAKAESSPFKAQVAAFVEADKAGDQAKLKKMIADFAAQAANAPTN